MAKLVCQVEHFLDANPRKPEAYQRFQNRMDTLDQEYDRWASIVFDDVTWMELAARRYHQFHLNPNAPAYTWFGGSTELLEQMVSQTATAVPLITGVACHVSHERVATEQTVSAKGKAQMTLGKDRIEKDELMGFLVRVPSAPGRLKDKQQLMSAYSEVYHMDVALDGDGNTVHTLQTKINTMWAAQTHIEAPNPCDPTYEALWANWPKDLERPLSKFLVYGDPGSGKTSFLATFPKPLLVFSFDPFGKEIPYLKLGTVIDTVDDHGTPVRQVFTGLKKAA